MSLEFLLTSLVLVLLPGTGVIYTLAFGLGKGFKASTLAAFGCTLGIVPHIAASIAGLAAILHASAMLYQGIKILGVLYLFYMAWMILRDGGALDVDENKDDVSAGKIVFSGFALNILNPKLSLFFLAFLPQFVPASAANATMAMLELAGIFMLMTFVVFIGYGAFASATRRYVVSNPKVMQWMKRSFAAAFALLGVRLALADR